MNKGRAILCIVPLSPPVTGASYASETLINFLKQRHKVDVIPYQRGNLKSGNFSLRQLMRNLAIGVSLLFKRNSYDSVYLVNSSSLWGNKRDLFFLFMLGKGLRKKTVLHRHGSYFAARINTASLPVRFLNKKLFGDVKNAIVLGATLKDIFNGYVQDEKVKDVKNFFSPELLIPKERLHAKFNSDKIKILFLSNLIKEKGCELLLDAFLALPEEVRRNAELHFAGECYSANEKEFFLSKIIDRKNIYYHGPVAGDTKKELFWNSHVFCLPTWLKFEGQPISIIEAYASGCIVVTTANGGINDIFNDNVNGVLLHVNFNANNDRIQEELRKKLGNKLQYILTNIDANKDIALSNRQEAESQYTENLFCKNIEKILIGELICN